MPKICQAICTDALITQFVHIQHITQAQEDILLPLLANLNKKKNKKKHATQARNAK